MSHHRTDLRVAGVAATVLFGVSSLFAASVPITVKETAGVGAVSYPISIVIPLPEGAYQNTSGFGLGVPAQFEVLNRWTAGDNSIRHVVAHVQADVAARGRKEYTFRDTGGSVPPARPVRVEEDAGLITVTTGPLRFTVNKARFTILDTVWFDRNGDNVYADSERVIAPDATHGARFEGCKNVSAGSCTPDLQYDRDLPQPTVVVEEAGPMRAVIKASVATSWVDTNDDADTDDPGEYLRHGYAVRIYAYAGLPHVKIDYQLQNSPIGPDLTGDKFAGPLYFEGLSLDWNLQLSGPVTVKTGTGGKVDTRSLGTAGVEIAHTLHDRFQVRQADGTNPWVNCGDDCFAEGFLDVRDGSRGVEVVTRYFWETWPNGIEIDGANRLSVQLWPNWSRAYTKVCDLDPTDVCRTHGECPGSSNLCDQYVFSSSGLYWLEDMQNAYKEVVLRFHDGTVSDGDLADFAKTVKYHPVPVVDRDWYNSTRATLDQIPINPNSSRVGSDTLTRQYSPRQLDENENGAYLFGWDVFGVPEPFRKGYPQDTGRWAHTAEWFLATESPDDYWAAEQWAIGELNVMPQWLDPAYRASDWPRLGLTAHPYGGGSWRAQGDTARYPIPGTGKDARARDDSHMWTYHVEESYYFTANPWIRDWYEFIAEYRKAHLRGDTTVTAREERAWGHMMENALQAYRVTGDRSLLDMLHGYVRDQRRPRMNPECGHESGEGGAGMQHGYLMRAVVDTIEELGGYDSQAWAELFSFLSAHMEWNYHYGKYGYNVNQQYLDDNGVLQWGGVADCRTMLNGSSGSALTMVDAVSWYYWNTGKTRFKQLNDRFVTQGIEGFDGRAGGRPGGDELWDSTWEGGYSSRTWTWERKQSRPDGTPPPRITDLRSTLAGTVLGLTWTAPAGAERYLIVWADRMISEDHRKDVDNFRNWWAATPVGTDLRPVPGQTQSLDIVVGATTGPVYAAIFTFDAAGNMSAMSNVAIPDEIPPEIPDPPTQVKIIDN